MRFLKNFDLKPVNIFKVVGLGLIAIIVITLAFRLIGSSFNSLSYKFKAKNTLSQMSEKYYAEEDMAYGGGMGGEMGLSMRNVVSEPMVSFPPTDDGVVIGDDSENFEVTEYSATTETRDLENSCAKIANLKSRDDIIFEIANEYEKSCYYYFKTEKGSAEEVLAIIESLDPKELDESTYTIKRLVDDYTSEIEILEKKLDSIEETLSNAVSAYDDIAELATNNKDAESLTKIIDSKIKIIERLMDERININSQLERIYRSKAEQLDRLEYVYFNVFISENKFVDMDDLKDSWKTGIKAFIRDINKIIQGVSIGLISILLLVLQYVIYLFILLIIVKYVWKFAKDIWQKK